MPRPRHSQVACRGKGSGGGIVKLGTQQAGPPVIRTLPLGSRVEVCPDRGVVISPVGIKLPVEGSYNSALAQTEESTEEPPAIRTLPVGSRVAV